MWWRWQVKWVPISPFLGTVHRDMHLLIHMYTLMPTLAMDEKSFSSYRFWIALKTTFCKHINTWLPLCMYLNPSFQWVLHMYNRTVMQLIDLIRLTAHKAFCDQTTWEWDYFWGHEIITINFEASYRLILLLRNHTYFFLIKHKNMKWLYIDTNIYNQTTANEIVGLVKTCRGHRGHWTCINKAY